MLNLYFQYTSPEILTITKGRENNFLSKSLVVLFLQFMSKPLADSAFSHEEVAYAVFMSCISLSTLIFFNAWSQDNLYNQLQKNACITVQS